jgi:hypothetical protein
MRVWLLIISVCLLGRASPLLGKPFASDLFCKAYPDVPACSGTALKCTFCHMPASNVPNLFGASLLQYMSDQNLSYPTTAGALRDVVEGASAVDADEDGISNGAEIAAGSFPGDKKSVPTVHRCSGTPLSAESTRWNHCATDPDYLYQKIWKDFCGEPPSYDEYADFKKLSAAKKQDEIEKQLETCLDSNHWKGKDGVVWEIGHYKIRPVGSVKAGEDPGLIPIVDYYADFNLFVYTQIDGHDARDMLLANYMVSRSGGGAQPTNYTRMAPQRLLDGQLMQPERRVGLITTFWNLGFYLNYTGIARVLVAQAYTAYLGLALSDMQGISPPPVELSKFRDYDQKGVTRPECAACHETIDALAYPFRNYNGLSGTNQVLQGQNSSALQNPANIPDEKSLVPLSYSLPRMDYLDQTYPGIKDMPEAGYIFGQRVETLQEWARVLVNSDAFAANLVKDYWKVLVGSEPKSPKEQAEFTKLWKDFKSTHNYSVEDMLRDLIKTEAYSVP